MYVVGAVELYDLKKSLHIYTYLPTSLLYVHTKELSHITSLARRGELNRRTYSLLDNAPNYPKKIHTTHMPMLLSTTY